MDNSDPTPEQLKDGDKQYCENGKYDGRNAKLDNHYMTIDTNNERWKYCERHFTNKGGKESL